jgi:hypothetical protein
MPDPLDTGVGFASRLVQNVYGLHKQEQDQGRADAEKSRQSMMAILEGAANSGNVNPEVKRHCHSNPTSSASVYKTGYSATTSNERT